MDFAFCFCQEYNDEETYCLITDIKQIAIHYVKGSCFFDLLAIIPFASLLVDGNTSTTDPKKDNARLFRLIKLLRVPRLFELLNVDRFKKYIKDYYNNRLQESVSNNEETENYPILRAIMYVQLYKVVRLAAIIITSSFFLGIMWHIICADLLPHNFKDDPRRINMDTFYSKYLAFDVENQSEPDSNTRVLVKMWYFAITTLSTIGYGDFSPQSKEERLIAIAILLFGVTMFSFIMSQFIEILLNYNSLSQFGNHKDLSKWIALLSRFNNGNPLNKDLITQIEDFFDYYWENNRLGAFVLDEDLRFMSELPVSVQGEIFVDYLFKDFIYKYRAYFSPIKKNTIAAKLAKLKEEKLSQLKKKDANLNQSHTIFAGSNEEQKNRTFLINFV